jgi:hypothetical protein
VQIEQRAEASALLWTARAYSDGDISGDWRERLRRLLSRPCSEDVTAERWVCARRGVKQFAQVWAAKATSRGWTFDELLSFVAPFANVLLQGAAWS